MVLPTSMESFPLASFGDEWEAPMYKCSGRLIAGLLSCVVLVGAGCAPPAEQPPVPVSIAAGRAHTCVVMSDATVRCWGGNTSGELGDGTTVNRPSAVKVNGLSDVAQIAAGSGTTCAVRRDGTVWCWGSNSYHVLGGFSGAISSVPVQITGIADAVSVGVSGNNGNAREFGQHGCVVRRTGGVSCWGGNAFGQLGNGTKTDSTVPVDVVGISDATQVAAGGAFTCAVSRSGSIKCWGSGAWGKLGIDDGNDHSTPVEVIGVSGATDLSAGSFYSCAIADGGMAMCWGMATFGQVGDGRNYSPFDPYRFVSPPKTVVGPVVTAGSGIAASPDPVYGTSAVGHSCAVRAGASVACWGINLSGELGVSSPSEVASMPVEVPGVSGVTDVVTGGSHSCALMSAEVRCWGNNTFGQLGAGPGLPWGPNPTPLTVKGL